MGSIKSNKNSYLVEIALIILVIGVPTFILRNDESKSNIIKALISFLLIAIIFGIYLAATFKSKVGYENDLLKNKSDNNTVSGGTVENVKDQEKLQQAFSEGISTESSDGVAMAYDRVEKLANSNYWMSVKVVQRRECMPMKDISVNLLNEMKKYDRDFSVLSFIDSCKQIMQMYYDCFYYLKTELAVAYFTKAFNDMTVLELKGYEEKAKRVQTKIIFHDIYPTAVSMNSNKILVKVFAAVEFDQYYCNYKNGAPYTIVKDKSRIRPLKLTFVSNRMYSELYTKKLKCTNCGKVIDPYICDNTCNYCNNEINIKRGKWLLAGIEEFNANTVDDGVVVAMNNVGDKEYVS